MKYDVILLTCLSGKVWQRPIGPYQLASHLRKHNFTVQVIDFTDYFTEEELVGLLEKFVGSNTRVVGVSSTFYQEEANDALDYKRGNIGRLPTNIRNSIEKIKQTNPHVKLVVGGGKSNNFLNDDLFDAVVHGYAEDVFLEYLTTKTIYPKIGNKSIVNGDERKFDIETLDHKWTANDCVLPGETLPIEISRGCIFKCKFCAYPLNGKNKFDYLRDPKFIAEELYDNYEKYKITNYFFADDTFNDSTYKLEQLHNEISKLPFKINFTTYLRLDLLHAHREQLALLKDMGLKSAFFGIESLNERTARFIGKGMDPEKVKDFILELKNNIWKDDISMLCTFIVGLPFEDIASTDRTFEWVKSAGINSAWTPLTISVDARYKSDIAINYEKYGYVIEDKERRTWRNEIMTSSDAKAASDRYNSYSLPNNCFSSWVLFAMLSYQLDSIESLQKTKFNEVNVNNYAQRHMSMIAQYKQLLKNS